MPATVLPVIGEVSVPNIPAPRSMAHLVIGGISGLVLWEIWAEVITPAIIGGPLQPPGLVISLADHVFHQKISYAFATYIHWIIGAVGYPALYWMLSRSLKNYGLILDAAVWTIFTAFLIMKLLGGALTPAMIYFWIVVTVVTATRFINPWPGIRDALSWGSFTWFNALGIFAPIAGLPFLLMEWGGGLSFMSYVGHIIFGFVLAVVFEWLESRSRI
jgi:hypothetical protein